MKDVETIRPEKLAIAAMLPRADVRDRLVGAASLADLAHGARIGTSSPRRSAQVLRARPDLSVVLLRGNVATRLAKIERGEADATLLAAAGLDRLGMADTGHAIPIDDWLPAPQQGAVGIEVDAGNAAVHAAVAAIDDAATSGAVRLERALLAALGADCRSPVAAFAQPQGGGYHLRAEILSEDGAEHSADAALITSVAEAADLGRRLIASAPPTVRALFAG
jgi:hydroxymethylbilane synthase